MIPEPLFEPVHFQQELDTLRKKTVILLVLHYMKTMNLLDLLNGNMFQVI